MFLKISPDIFDRFSAIDSLAQKDSPGSLRDFPALGAIIVVRIKGFQAAIAQPGHFLPKINEKILYITHVMLTILANDLKAAMYVMNPQIIISTQAKETSISSFISVFN
jgi:hypothetical protein